MEVGMHGKLSQDSGTVPKEAVQETLRSFFEAVYSQYGKRNSPISLHWPDIHMLSTTLLAVRNIKIQKSEEKYFINSVMDYVELVLCFVSNYDISGFKRQIQYVHILLNFIPDFFNESGIANTFIKRATTKVFDLFLHGSFSNISKKELLSVFNRIASQSSKEVRVNTAETEMMYMYKLVDSLFTFGDYALQADILETIFRVFGTYFRSNKIEYDLLPECNELGKALITEISIKTFDADVRSWLNRFNKDSLLNFSIAFQSLMFGNTPCKCPDEGQGKRWIDFNLIEPMVSFFTEDDQNDHWNRIVILPKYAKKVEVKRNFSTNESTTVIFLQLAKPCLTYSLNVQKYLDTADRNIKIIISNDEKENITKLISHVLPRLFGDSFMHTSARISDTIKKVYKPLGVKVSRLRPTTSVSSCNSRHSEGSTSTVNSFKYSSWKCVDIEREMKNDVPVVSSKRVSALSPLLFDEAKRDSVKLPKCSKTPILNNTVMPDDISCVITDYTACSSRASVNSYNFSMDSVMQEDRFDANNSKMPDPSTYAPQPPLKMPTTRGGKTSGNNFKTTLLPTISTNDRENLIQSKTPEKLQDNIVTSSHKFDDLPILSNMEIVSGNFRNSISSLLSDNLQFEPLCECSSSPVKRSILITREPSEDMFQSISGEENEEFETAEDCLEPHAAIKKSQFKGLEIDSIKIAKISEPLKTSQVKDLFFDSIKNSEPDDARKRSHLKVLDIGSSAVGIQQDHSNNQSDSKLDNKHSPEVNLQNNVNLHSETNDDCPPSSHPLAVQAQPILETCENELNLTPDLFEAAAQIENVPISATVDANHSDTDTDEIFSRPTQVYRAVDLNSQENFPGLSMNVNIGVPEEELSEQIFKSNETIAALVPNSKTVIEDGVEMVFIDLTIDDEPENEDEQDIHEEHVVDCKLQLNQKVSRMETPELICALTNGSFQSYKLEKRTHIKANKSTIIAEDISSLKEQTMNKRQKGKAKRLIVTGTKKFELKKIDSKTDLGTNVIQETHTSAEVFDLKPEVSSAGINHPLMKKEDISRPKFGFEERHIKKSKYRMSRKKMSLGIDEVVCSKTADEVLENTKASQKVIDATEEIPLSPKGRTSVLFENVLEEKNLRPTLGVDEKQKIKKAKSKGLPQISNKKTDSENSEITLKPVEATPENTETSHDIRLEIQSSAMVVEEDTSGLKPEDDEEAELKKLEPEDKIASVDNLQTLSEAVRVVQDSETNQGLSPPILSSIEKPADLLKNVIVENNSGSNLDSEKKNECKEKYQCLPQMIKMQITSEHNLKVNLKTAELEQETEDSQDIIAKIPSIPRDNAADLTEKVMEGITSRPNLKPIKEQKIKKLKMNKKKIASENSLEVISEAVDIVKKIKINDETSPKMPSSPTSLENVMDIDNSKSNSVSHKENQDINSKHENFSHMNENLFLKNNSKVTSKALLPIDMSCKVSDKMAVISLSPEPMQLEKVIETDISTVKIEKKPKKVKKTRQKLATKNNKKKGTTALRSDGAPKLDVDGAKDAIILQEKKLQNECSKLIQMIPDQKDSIHFLTEKELTLSEATTNTGVDTIHDTECNHEEDMLTDHMLNNPVLLGKKDLILNTQEGKEKIVNEALDIALTSKEQNIEEEKNVSQSIAAEIISISQIQIVEGAVSNCDDLNTAQLIKPLETQSELEDNMQCGIVKMHVEKNLPVINVLENLTLKVNTPFKKANSMDMVDSQIASQVQNKIGEKAQEAQSTLSKYASKRNTVDPVKLPVVGIVQAVVHVSANEDKQAKPAAKHVENAIFNLNMVTTAKDFDVNAIEILPSPKINNNHEPMPLYNLDTYDKLEPAKSSTPITTNEKFEKSKGNKSNTTATPRRKLYRPGSYSYLEQLNMETSSEFDSDYHPSKKNRNLKNKIFKNQPKRKTMKANTRKRKRGTNNDSSVNHSKYQGLTELFNQSCSKHLESSKAYEKRFELTKFGGTNYENLDIVTRFELSSSSSDERRISVLNKSAKSSPELIITSSDHYSFPELEIEPSDGKKINILGHLKRYPAERNTNAPKRMRLEVEEAADEHLFTIGEETTLAPSQHQNLETVHQMKDTGFLLIKQIVDFVENKQLNSDTKLKILRDASNHFTKAIAPL